MSIKNTCIVVGHADQVGATKKELEARGVRARAFQHNIGHEKIAALCAAESDLQVVAVFCRNFVDQGASLFAALRKQLNGSVSLHALVEAGSQKKPRIVEKLDSTVNAICIGMPLNPAKAAIEIRKRWFPDAVGAIGEEADGNAARVTSSGTTVSELPGMTVRTHRIGDEEIETLSRSEEDSDDDIPAPSRQGPPRTAAVPKEPKPASMRPAAAKRVGPVKVPKVNPDAPLEAKQRQRQDPEKKFLGTTVDVPTLTFGKLLESLKRNPVLPAEPTAKRIVGMDGKTVLLDPRRIRRLPENPRNRSNPGLSDEGLRKLGDNIKLVGQMEEIRVCPFADDQKFDAQLIDGECRTEATERAHIFVRAKVDESVTPEQVSKLYFMSVVSNKNKTEFTAYDNVRIVAKFRDEYGMTIQEIAGVCDATASWVSQQMLLGKLEHDVQEMLEGGSAQRRLTSQIAVLLVDIEAAGQRSAAEEIVDKKMNYRQARRFVLNLRRGRGLARSPTGENRHSKQFDSLGTLTRHNLDAYGIYLDMLTAELMTMLASRSGGERSGVCQDLRKLSTDVATLAKRLEKCE